MHTWCHHTDIDDIWTGLIDIDPRLEVLVNNIIEQIVSINLEVWDNVTLHYGERKRDIYLIYWCVIFAELFGWPDRKIENLEKICAVYFHTLFLWRYLDDVIDLQKIDLDAVERYSNMLICTVNMISKEPNCSLYIENIKKYSSIGLQLLQDEREGNLKYHETWKRSALFLMLPSMMFNKKQFIIYKRVINFISLIHDTLDWPTDYKNSVATIPIRILKSYAGEKILLKKDVYSFYIKELLVIVDKKYSILSRALSQYRLTSFLVENEYSEVINLRYLIENEHISHLNSR